MPRKIPIYKDRETYSGKPRKVFSLGGERSRTQTVPFAEDTRVQSVAKVINYIGDKMTEAEELDQYNRGMISIKKGADAIVEEANTEWKDLGLKGHQEAFDQRWKTLQEEVGNSIKSNNTKRALVPHIEAARLSTMTEVRGMAHKRVYDNLIAGAVTAKETHLNEAIAAPNENAAIQSTADLYAVNKGLVEQGAITKQQAALDNEKYESIINLGYLTRFVEDPVQNKIIIHDGHRIRTPEEVLKYMNKQKLFKDTDELDKDKVIKHAFTVYSANLANSKVNSAESRRAHKAWLADNDFQAIRDYNTGDLSKMDIVELNRLADAREITREMYEKIYNDMQAKKKDPTRVTEADSIMVTGDISAEIASGIFDSEEMNVKLDIAFIEDQMSRGTYIALKTKMADKAYQLGLKQITNMYKPLPGENLTPARATEGRRRYTKMIQEYHKKIEELGDPMKAASEIVGLSLDEPETRGVLPEGSKVRWMDAMEAERMSIEQLTKDSFRQLDLDVNSELTKVERDTINHNINLMFAVRERKKTALPDYKYKPLDPTEGILGIEKDREDIKNFLNQPGKPASKREISEDYKIRAKRGRPFTKPKKDVDNLTSAGIEVSSGAPPGEPIKIEPLGEALVELMDIDELEMNWEYLKSLDKKNLSPREKEILIYNVNLLYRELNKKRGL